MPARILVAAILLAPAGAVAQPRFTFESVATLDEMKALVRQAAPVGTSRDALRRRFVAEGGATLVPHPIRPDVEKYIYDIDLCGFYIWRWNISADFGTSGVRQVYINGEPALSDGPADAFQPGPAPSGKTSTIVRGARLRPEAHKGESSLGYILFDQDGDSGTINDQRLLGGGPTRPDPTNMGQLRTYNVDPWRSIFDQDAAARIAPYRGDCAAADAVMAKQKPK